MKSSGHSAANLFRKPFQKFDRTGITLSDRFDDDTGISIPDTVHLQQYQQVSPVQRIAPRTCKLALKARPYTHAGKAELEEDTCCITDLTASGARSEAILNVLGQ